MSELPDVNLAASERRALQRQAIDRRTADGGRRVDHLKRRSLDAQAAQTILEAVERGALAPSASQILTGHDAEGKTTTRFIMGWSRTGGTDVMG